MARRAFSEDRPTRRITSDISYYSLKTAVWKSCKVGANRLDFEVNEEQLQSAVSSIGLTYVALDSKKAEPIEPKDIINLSEYFKDQALTWITKNRYYKQLLFVKTENFDENLQSLIDSLALPAIENPEIDRTNIIATIIAKYPCYFVTIISYRSNDPKRYGKTSYSLCCRANEVVIKNSVRTQYTPEEGSTETEETTTNTENGTDSNTTDEEAPEIDGSDI